MTLFNFGYEVIGIRECSVEDAMKIDMINKMCLPCVKHLKTDLDSENKQTSKDRERIWFQLIISCTQNSAVSFLHLFLQNIFEQLYIIYLMLSCASWAARLV